MRIYLSFKKTYAISVVIPMYNAEKYITECLDSLLLQTFQDFEVIVVDDCSTDNSVKIVESYLPKFNGRLKLTKTEKNSGGGGYIPRNTGFKLASGKYVYFVDADDFLLSTGLEALYKTAEKFNADVSYIASHYRLDRPNDLYVSRDGKGNHLAAKKLEDKPTFMADDTNKILRDYLQMQENHAPWAIFVKRDFLIENRILFPEKIYNGGDGIWNIHLRCLSKRFLRNPTPVYFQRCYVSESITRKKRSLTEQVIHKIRAFSLWIKALWELSKKVKFLKENPVYVYDAFKIELEWMLNGLRGYQKQLSDREIYEIAYNEFAHENNPPDWTELFPFFFTSIGLARNINDYYFDIINKFKRYFTARVEIKLMVTTGNFEILSVSDKEAKLVKPNWFQKNGIGYQLQSYAGKLNFIAKATVDGEILLKLRGIEIRDPKNKSKCIPYWIDYTKLIVNDKVIFDEITPSWHDKPCHYNLEAKAGEEIPIQIEWLPHRADTIEPKAETPPPIKTETPLPVKVESAISDSFKPFITARIDVKFVAKSDVVDFRILSLSDEKAIVFKPNWYQKNETGYVIQSITGNLEIVSKAGVDGQVQLRLRGVWVSDPKDKSKLIPYWIDYTKLIVNEEPIFDTLTPAWHDKSYNYNLEVKANEEIKIQVEWQPHKSDPNDDA